MQASHNNCPETYMHLCIFHMSHGFDYELMHSEESNYKNRIIREQSIPYKVCSIRLD